MNHGESWLWQINQTLVLKEQFQNQISGGGPLGEHLPLWRGDALCQKKKVYTF